MSVEILRIVGLEGRFEYEISQIAHLFIEGDTHRFSSFPSTEKGLELRFALSGNVDPALVRCSLWSSSLQLWQSGERISPGCSEDINSPEKPLKRACLRLAWRALSFYTGVEPPWGILTGVRPVKVAHEILNSGKSVGDACAILEGAFLMRGDKARLTAQVAVKEAAFIYPVDREGFALYYGVPFCPSRCSYCSFPAFTGAAKQKLIPAYLSAMVNESARTAEILSRRHVDSIYIGGGTPTMLNAEQLDTLLTHIWGAYDLSRCREITVEAGRPDTIDVEKLNILRHHGVSRICLNPQSFSDRTLKRIGRNHSSEEILAAVEQIREVGFKTLNMDVILGLPGETIEDVRHTLRVIENISPENLTVHTLAVKRGSELRQNPGEYTSVEQMEAMLEASSEAADRMGMAPYYMYRQKFMLANLENVGYAKPGHEGIYNMQIMEEQQDILSFGAGGVSKVCFPQEGRHERVPNVRGLEEYLGRWDEMAQRKVAMLSGGVK